MLNNQPPGCSTTRRKYASLHRPLSLRLMRFYLPRCCRRPLLFPPGLLALAGLLWLGCVAVSAHSDRLRKRVVIELVLPPKPVSDAIDPRPYVNGGCVWPKENGPELTWSNLAHFRRWSAMHLGKDPLTDTLVIHHLKAILASHGPKPNWQGSGLKIYFGPKAHYSSLIAVLNLMEHYDAHQYFLDVNHGPLTFYALTIKQPVCPLMPF